MDRELSIDNDRRLEDLLEHAKIGERLLLTRGGKVVATVVPTVEATDRSESIAAMERILEIGDRVSLGGLRFKDLIDEGRKY